MNFRYLLIIILLQVTISIKDIFISRTVRTVYKVKCTIIKRIGSSVIRIFQLIAGISDSQIINYSISSATWLSISLQGCDITIPVITCDILWKTSRISRYGSAFTVYSILHTIQVIISKFIATGSGFGSAFPSHTTYISIITSSIITGVII